MGVIDMRVYLVDAQPVFREGLKSIMRSAREFTVVGEADACSDVMRNGRMECDLVVLDGELDSLAFLQLLEKTRVKGRPPFTLVLTRHTEDQHAIQMLAAGANGYLSKSKPPETIIDAMRKVARGGRFVSGELAETVLFNLERIKRPARLSNREYQVLYLFASGLATKEIAGQLALSVKTISTYRCRLLEKLNLSTNAQLMRYAYKEGVISE
jgi:two-component system, NarL family, invasion response regulator UvrY